MNAPFSSPVSAVLRCVASRPEDADDAARSLALGEVSLANGDGWEAADRLELAARVFAARGDAANAARAQRGLGLALTMLRDPRGRAVLEDAGTMFEDLGEDEIVRAIDAELRLAASDFLESPRSFQATSALRRAG